MVEHIVINCVDICLVKNQSAENIILKLLLCPCRVRQDYAARQQQRVPLTLQHLGMLSELGS